MNSDDQLQPPSAESNMPALGSITPLMIAHLRATKPWVRLVSIMGFIGSAFIILAAMGMLVFGVLSSEFGAAAGLGLAAVYLLMGCLYFFPALFLFRYASAIHSLVNGGDSKSMELALLSQMNFWRLLGIMTLAMLCLYGALLFLGVVVGMFAALS
jgi:hypothetical protein